MAVEIDETTGLPKLPKRMYWEVEIEDRGNPEKPILWVRLKDRGSWLFGYTHTLESECVYMYDHREVSKGSSYSAQNFAWVPTPQDEWDSVIRDTAARVYETHLGADPYARWNGEYPPMKLGGAS